MVRAVVIGLAILVVMAVFHEANAQVCTKCLSGGYCSCAYPQCCIVNGVKMCCRILNTRSTTQLNKDTEATNGKALGSSDSQPRSELPLLTA